MLFLYSFSYKLCLILFGHTAIMYQYRWTLWGTRGNVVMVHIVPISPPLFFRPPKFIVWVVFWYFDFCHLRVKKIKERFRTDIPEITLKRTDKSYSPLYSLSPDYVVGRSCRTDPAPFRFSPNTCYKSIVPLQGFEPCFVLRLFNQSYTPYTKWRVPSAANGGFRCLEITPEKRGYAFLNRLKTNS